MKSKLGIPLEGFAEFCRHASSQGAVLLKNEDNILPIKNSDKVSIFGRCQINYYKSGTGSGGAVNTLYTTDFLNSLRKQMPQVINEDLAKVYENWIYQNPFDNGGGGWAAEPWNQKEMTLNDELLKSAKQNSQKAIIIIGRTAGEDKDNLNEAGSYLLTQEEEKMIELVDKYFSEIIVLLNVSNIIDMKFIEKYKNIKSVMYVWHGGMEGGNGAVDVIIGKVNPSGKLPNTIAYDITDYPSTKNHGGVTKNIYEEDIYVGYRYFETFKKDKVMYPFGFGLSYTTFDICNMSANFIGEINCYNEVTINVDVTNRGNVSGKEVIQVYVNKPQGKLGKPDKELVAFEKTKELLPNETQTLQISIPINYLASYDDSGVSGFKYSYVLEEGEYKFLVGNSVRNTTEVKLNNNERLVLEETVLIKRLTQALAPTNHFNRIKPKVVDGKFEIEYEKAPTKEYLLRDRINKNQPIKIKIEGNKDIKLSDVRENKFNMEEFISQLTLDDLEVIVRGEGMSHPKVTPGTASAFGGVSKNLRNLGIPLMCTADGPSGIRMESGLKSTQLPIGTLLSSTWDTELVEKLYIMEGKELVRNCIDLLLGPGMNLHRNPLNGRNFEYYSEDPILTGKIASAVVKGIDKGGSCATLKHFACNSQETYRHEVDAIISERALRELYLRCFEIPVKEGNAKSIMTAYNPINGNWSASNYDLNTTILRNEWGFKGIVMTDWWAKMNDIFEKGEGSRENIASMVKSQNDVYMVIGNFGAQNNENNDNTRASLENGYLTLEELQRCAINICNFAITTKAMDRDYHLFGECLEFEPTKVESELVFRNDTNNVLDTLDKKIIEFNFLGTEEYEVFVTYKCIANGLAQVTCNIFVNDDLMTTVQAGNTKDKFITKKLADVKLKDGGYKLVFESFSDDLIISKVEFVKIK